MALSSVKTTVPGTGRTPGVRSLHDESDSFISRVKAIA
jgi:hypothetical protein